MDRAKSDGPCYYSILGIRNNASVSEIRNAYRKLALKWHPDRWMRDPAVVGEAKRRFQQIQEAYSVLSDEGKRAMYDAGMYDPFEEEDEGFSDFMQEMLSMMDHVRAEAVKSVICRRLWFCGWGLMSLCNQRSGDICSGTPISVSWV
ncbi:hypothetical protein AAC387_Pa10g1881 [Persea americana]